MPQISVIVPIYNCEIHLSQCIDSILSQTFTDFDLSLINDGSKDYSGTICDEYAAKDSRVRVFHKENGGVSSARNVGLNNAKGDYVMFVDSDDILPENAIELLINNLSYADLIIGGYKDQNGNLFAIDYYKSLILQDEFNKFLSKSIDTAFLRAPWAKLFKNEILQKKKLRFDENLVFGEDHVFNISYLMYCRSIYVIKDTCYIYYNIGNEYINKYKHHNDKILDFCDKITDKYKTLNKNYQLSGSRIVYGFIFDILKINLDEGVCSIKSFKKFILNSEVRKTLHDRQNLYIKCILILAYFPTCILKLYFLIIKKIKNVKDFSNSTNI